MKQTTQKKLFGTFAFLALILALRSVAAPRGTNLFDPYDPLLEPTLKPNSKVQLSIIPEYAFRFYGYQHDDYELCDEWRKRKDILQLYQDYQDTLAALKAEDYATAAGQLAQLYNLNDDNGSHGYYIPCGDLEMTNVMLAARYNINRDWYIGAYIPYIFYELKNVSWHEAQLPNVQNETAFESNLNPNIISDIENIGDLYLGSWSRSGFGDLALLAVFNRTFTQARPLLKHVSVNMRGGMTFGVGKRTEEDKLFGLPFSYDAGSGILFAARLDLHFGSIFHAGVDGQFIYLFGSTHERRIKTDLAQTDLLFLAKTCTYRHPGFVQHFTLYTTAQDFAGGLSARLAYQYTKQQEDTLYLCSDHYTGITANTAEKLDEWTIHNVIASLNYDFGYQHPEWKVQPELSVLYKHGFNGKRAIGADTISLQFNLSF